MKCFLSKVFHSLFNLALSQVTVTFLNGRHIPMITQSNVLLEVVRLICFPSFPPPSHHFGASVFSNCDRPLISLRWRCQIFSPLLPFLLCFILSSSFLISSFSTFARIRLFLASSLSILSLDFIINFEFSFLRQLLFAFVCLLFYFDFQIFSLVFVLWFVLDFILFCKLLFFCFSFSNCCVNSFADFFSILIIWLCLCVVRPIEISMIGKSFSLVCLLLVGFFFVHVLFQSLSCST